MISLANVSIAES